MKNFNWILSVLSLMLVVQSVSAHVGPLEGKRKERVSLRNDCAPSTAETDLAVNNVRARLIAAGELFTSGGDGRYIVPQRDPASGLDEVSSVYAAAVWIGGFQPTEDGTGVLKMAAQTFRQTSGVDFWPGPLDPNDGTTNAERCRDWDRFFRVTGDAIEEHLANFEKFRAQGVPYPATEVPEELRAWPALGNPFFSEFYDFELPDSDVGLGNYADIDNNGIYDPTGGDFPIIDIEGCDPIEDPQYPDDMYFFVYNDNGNVHEVTRSDAIRMEVQVQAFGYATQDEVNNMTFYRYKLINRAPEPIDSTFFAMWLDPDLGCPNDDFIGCDTASSLMYVYNEDAVDGINGCDCVVGSIIPTYCNEVPILGVDYFRGPIELVFDPETGETKRVELGMTSFTYYNNNSGQPGQRDPQTPAEFYNYLIGRWRDGTPFTFGGDGYLDSEIEVNYAFFDPPDLIGGWSMCDENLEQGDRRTLQATGPLRLLPGQINELIIGVVWLPEANYPCPSIEPLLSADRTSQGLFDNCFDILDGPEPPVVNVLELDQELIFTLQDIDYDYQEVDPRIEAGTVEDSVYVFEGIRVYQLRNSEITPVAENFANPENAREVLQYDLRNNVTSLYNWSSVNNPNSTEPLFQPSLQVNGTNTGIENSFSLTQDAFASGEDNRLINFTQYYFAVVAYGTNNYQPYDVETGIGQRITYLINRDGARSQVSGTPRRTAHLDLNSMYGEGLEVTRLDGEGVHDNIINISGATRQAIVDANQIQEVVYELGMSPLNARVFDPVNILDGTYTLTFEPYESDPGLESTRFVVRNDQTGVSDTSEFPISQLNETLLTNFGFSVRFAQGDEPGKNPFLDETNGFLGAALTYGVPGENQWYNFIAEGSGPGVNFIKTEIQGEKDYRIDPNQVFSTQVNTGFYPFVLNAFDTTGVNLAQSQGILYSPAWFNSFASQIRSQVDTLTTLNNVDIVFTSNKDNWSKCMVVQSSNYAWQGLVQDEWNESMDLVRNPSVGKEASIDNPNLPAELNDGTVGFAYFPGYAVDVETGRRLNIFFGENTAFDPSNARVINQNLPAFLQVSDSTLTGNDMIWNPNQSINAVDNVVAGNLHYIFVTDQTYDGCDSLHGLLSSAVGVPPIVQNIRKRDAFSRITWAGFPLLAPGEELLSYADGLIPNDLTISMRVKNDFQYTAADGPNGGLNQYRIEVDGKQATARIAGEELENRLDLINVVPNPYYAYSRYELQATDNVVKITNLPQVCTISIYSLDGKFIRQYDRNVSEASLSGPNPNQAIPDSDFPTDVEWDLKNSQGILVSSGVYYIHVEAPGLGERVLKWFGVNRKFDPSALN